MKWEARVADDPVTVEALLERAASLNLNEVIVIGEDPDGGGYLASTTSDPEEVLAFLVNAIIMLSISSFQDRCEKLH